MPARILVADDDSVSRQRLIRSLEKRGFAALGVGNGASALQILGGQLVDLVILDNMMPGISGLQVLTTLRKHFTPAQLPVLMVTADSMDDSVLEALALGANGYLVKPLEIESLLSRVVEQLGYNR
jgi:two-component system, sensor histidine kinase ChiS